MTEHAPVVAEIRNHETGETIRIPLGSWRDVWSQGVTIGRDPSCTIVLEDDRVSDISAGSAGTGIIIFWRWWRAK